MTITEIMAVLDSLDRPTLTALLHVLASAHDKATLRELVSDAREHVRFTPPHGECRECGRWTEVHHLTELCYPCN